MRYINVTDAKKWHGVRAGAQTQCYMMWDLRGFHLSVGQQGASICLSVGQQRLGMSNEQALGGGEENRRGLEL